MGRWRGVGYSIAKAANIGGWGCGAGRWELGLRDLVSRAKAPAGTVYYGEENVVRWRRVVMVCGFDN